MASFLPAAEGSVIRPQLLQKRSRTLGIIVSSNDSKARAFNLSLYARGNFLFRFIAKANMTRVW